MSQQEELELYGFTFLSGHCCGKSNPSKYSKKCKKRCFDAFASLLSLAVVITTIMLTTVAMEDELRCGRCNKHIKVKPGIEAIPDYLYSGCKVAETVELPGSLVAIGERAFSETRIKKITLPESVRYIDYAAFQESELEEINLDFVEEIGYYAFDGAKLREIGHLSPKLTEINDYAFYGCLFTRLEISDGVKRIGYGALGYNKKIESLVISDSVTSIRDYAFYECSNLRTVKLSENIKNISPHVFRYCTSLEEITIPSSVQEISNNAFEGATGLKKITLQEGLRRISSYAFVYSGLTQIEFPDTLEIIYQYAFYNCNGLFSIKFGIDSKISEIGRGAFQSTALAETIFPVSIKKLNSSSFYGLKVAKFRGDKDSVEISREAFSSFCKIIWNYTDSDNKQNQY